MILSFLSIFKQITEHFLAFYILEIQHTLTFFTLHKITISVLVWITNFHCISEVTFPLV